MLAQSVRARVVARTTHIGLATSLPMYVAVHSAVPVKSVKDLIALAKAKPDALHFYSSGSGGMPHLVGEIFTTATGAPIVHVPYKGSGPGVVDLAAGNVQLGFDSLPSIFPHAQSGRIRLIATVGKHRSGKYPELPSLAENRLPAGRWQGLVRHFRSRRRFPSRSSHASARISRKSWVCPT